MPGNDKTLKVSIVGDASKARKALADLDGSLAKSEGSTRSFASTAGKLLAGAGLMRLVTGSLSDANESLKIAHQTEAVIKSTGGAAGVSAEQVGDFASSISNATGLDDEWVQSGENMLLTFKNVRNEAGKGNDIFTQTTQVMADMAVATGTDATGAAKTLGMALNDPVTGLSRLTRVGVTFTQSQKDQIKAMAESGNVMGAQKIMLAELSSEFGGSAAAQTSALDKIHTQLGNMSEALGTALMPALDAVAPLLTTTADVMGSLPAPITGAVAAVAGAGAAWNIFGGFITGTVGTIRGWVGSIGSMVTPTGIATGATEGLASALTVEAEAAAASSGANAANAASTGRFAGKLAGLATKLGIAAVAAGAMGTAAKSWLDHIQPASADTDRLTTALQYFVKTGREAGELKNLGGIKGMAEDMKRLQSESTGVNGALNKTVGTIFHIVTAGQGGASGLERLTSKVDSYDKTLAEMVKSGHPEQAKAAVMALTDAAAKQGMSTSDLKKYLDDYSGALQDMGLKSDLAVTKTDVMNKIQEQQKAKADASKKAIDDLSSALKNYSDTQTSLLTGEIAVQGSFDQLTQSLKENGNQWDIHNQKGRDNYGTLLQVKDAMYGVAQSMIDQGQPIDQVNKKWNEMVWQLIATMSQSGLTQGEIQNLINQMGLTPSSITTIFKTTAPQAQQDAQNLLNVLNSFPTEKRIAIEMAMYGAGSIFGSSPGHAWGGRLNRGLNLVGEHGPELVDRDSVIGAGRTRALMDRLSSYGPASSGGGVTVIYQTDVHVAGSVRADRDLAETVADELMRRQRRSATPILPGVSG